MRLVLLILAIIYFFIRLLWVDEVSSKYFIVDYFEAVDFVSSYTYDPEDFVKKRIVPYFNAISIRLKSLNELKSEGKVDLSSYELSRIDAKPWLIHLTGKPWPRNVSFVYCINENVLFKIEKVIRELGMNYERIGNILVVYSNSKYLFNLQVFFVDELEDILKGRVVFWRVSSYVYNLDYLKSFVRENDFIMFTGPFVGGYSVDLESTRKFIRQNKLIFAFPEFYDSKNAQLGASYLAKDNAVKVFSTMVLKNKNIDQVLSSIDLALNERNCRAIFFRFFDRYPLFDNLKLIETISKNIRPSNSDFSVRDFGISLDLISWIYLIFFAFVVFISYSYYYDLIVANNYNISSFWFFIFGLINSVGLIISKLFGWSFVFNLFVIIGVSFVVVSMFFRVFESGKNIYVRYFEIIGYSTAIGIILNSLFFSSTYSLGVEKVGLIKLLLILPIFLSLFIVFSYNNVVLFFYRRMRILDFVIILGLFSLVGIYLVRSGNFGVVFPFEDKIREFMDKLLIARPRFKEWLIGNPAILASSYNRYFLPFSFISVAGIINSFLHIHTPIFYSFLRTLWAALLGLIVFIVLKKLFEGKSNKKG